MVDQIIRPADLPDRPTPNASEKVPVDNGVTVAGSTIEALVNAGRPLASQAEAEGGLQATKAMTPLTTKQSIAYEVGVSIASKAQGDLAASAVQEIIQGTNITVDITDPIRPVISSTGGVTDGDKGDIIVSNSGTEWIAPRLPLASRAWAIANFAPEIAPEFVITSGYSSAGDGGGALYKRVDSEPAHAGKFSITLSDTVTVVWYEFASSPVSPRMFGAKGDGITDDRPSIQNAIDYAETNGEVVVIPYGEFAVGELTRGGNTACLHSKGVSWILGFGRQSKIKPLSSVGSTTNTIHIAPTDTESAANFTIKGLFLGDPSTGLRQGLHGIFLDTRVGGANFPAPRISDMYICQSRDGSNVSYGKAIMHQNDQSLNINGGMYGAVIENNRGLGGGVAFLDSGDSNTIRTSIISGLSNTGIGYRCVGVDVSLCTSGGGAGFLVLEDLNITAEAGAYRVVAGKDIYVSRVYGEHLSADAGIPISTGGRALGVIAGGGDTISAGYVHGGRLVAATGASTLVTTNLYMANVHGFSIDGGISLYPGKSSGGYGIEFESSSYENTVRRIGYSPNISGNDKIVDRGTRNLFNQQATLALVEANFTNFGSGTALAKAMRSETGEVSIEGVLTCAANPSGKTITTLPIGFRPIETIILNVHADVSGAVTDGSIVINPSGVVDFSGDNASTRISISCSFRVSGNGIMNG